MQIRIVSRRLGAYRNQSTNQDCQNIGLEPLLLFNRSDLPHGVVKRESITISWMMPWIENGWYADKMEFWLNNYLYYYSNYYYLISLDVLARGRT